MNVKSPGAAVRTMVASRAMPSATAPACSRDASKSVARVFAVVRSSSIAVMGVDPSARAKSSLSVIQLCDGSGSAVSGSVDFGERFESAERIDLAGSVLIEERRRTAHLVSAGLEKRSNDVLRERRILLEEERDDAGHHRR